MEGDFIYYMYDLLQKYGYFKKFKLVTKDHNLQK